MHKCNKTFKLKKKRKTRKSIVRCRNHPNNHHRRNQENWDFGFSFENDSYLKN